jgi:hypothetical protein
VPEYGNSIAGNRLDSRPRLGIGAASKLDGDLFMADASNVLPSEAPAPQAERLHMLHRIAEALDLQLSDLYGHALRQGESPPTEAECAAAMAAFLRISDPSARRRCIALMQALANP